MPTLSARLVLRPKTKAMRCDECNRFIGPHIYWYGYEWGEWGPSPRRLCIPCAATMRDEKIVTLVEKFHVEAERVRAEASMWRDLAERAIEKRAAGQTRKLG